MKGKRAAVASILDPLIRTGVLGALAQRRGLLVLNYHRIGYPQSSNLDRGLFSATPESFEQQVEFLRNNCRLLSIGDVLKGIYRRERHCVMLTFDDGYRDNYTEAFPVLHAAGIPAAFFVATGFIDRPRLPWWDEIAFIVRRLRREARLSLSTGALTIEATDPERQIRRVLTRYKQASVNVAAELMAELRSQAKHGTDTSADALWMTWDMIRELKASGMDIGGHTANHPILASLDEVGQRAEIDTCTFRLESELGERPVAFAYPVGGPTHFDRTTRAVLSAAGYRLAFSFYGGWNAATLAWDEFDIRRTSVESSQSMSEFRMVCTMPRMAR